MASKSLEFPDEILDKLQAFHQQLKKTEEIMSPLMNHKINSPDLKLSAIEKAKLNLTYGYALNSLFWMYLSTMGIDPKEHQIKSELDRYKSFMLTVKEITDKKFAPVLDKGAAKRFVRNALWEPKDGEGGSPSTSMEEPEENQLKRSQNSRYSREENKKKKKRRC